MRPDMGRLIIEDGRRGDGGSKSMYDKVTRCGEDYENLRQHESMSRHRKQDCNSQGDRLQPLRKFLEANCGRPWNKVYSEVVAVNDRRSIRGYHLLTHLKQYVTITPELHRYGAYWHQFYVDKFGLLKKTPESFRSPWRNWRKPKEEVKQVTINGVQYQKKEEIWFRVQKWTTTYTAPVWPEQIYEDRGRLRVRVRECTKEHERLWTCNKKEIQRIQEALKN